MEHPAARRERAIAHLLDSVGAMVSGAVLPAGKLGRRQAGTRPGPASVALGGCASPEMAAYANAMCAHADESDDAHQGSTTHPGAAVVPAALAAAEEAGATGAQVIASVIAGYELCARIGSAMGSSGFIVDRGFDTHAFGGVFGAGAAAGVIHLDREAQFASLLSLCAHEASGLAAVFRDPHHIEKAYVFAAMPARNGVLAAQTALAGLPAVEDTLDGRPGLFSAFGVEGHVAFEDLSHVHAIENTNIKRWTVGSPAQAALDAVEILLPEIPRDTDRITRVTVELPVHGARVVDGRGMPTINAQHLVALMLIDRAMSFQSSHDRARMDDPAVAGLRDRVTLVPSETLSRAEPTRQAIVQVELEDGRRLRHHVKAVRGTVENPMPLPEIVEKVRGLCIPVIGEDRTAALVDAVLGIETAPGLERLGQALRAPT